MRTNIRTDWVADQVIATLREHGRPMNSSEIGSTTPYVHANGCQEERGEDCWHLNGDPISLGGARVHVHTRGHTTADHASEVLTRLQKAGVVTREKVGRRVMWSLSPDYLTQTREGTTVAAALLMQAGLSDATAEELAAARKADTRITVEWMMDAAGLRSMVDDKVAALVARGIEVTWTADPHRAKSDDDEWTASVDFRSNGPLLVTVVSIWEGAPVERQARALGVASRQIDNVATRIAHPRGFVIR